MSRTLRLALAVALAAQLPGCALMPLPSQQHLDEAQAQCSTSHGEDHLACTNAAYYQQAVAIERADRAERANAAASMMLGAAGAMAAGASAYYNARAAYVQPVQVYQAPMHCTSQSWGGGMASLNCY